MTEAEWLSATDPQPMLVFLGGKVSDRKFRLIACACCRLTWELLTDEGREAIQYIERFADGVAGLEELDWAVGRANESVATCRQDTACYCAGLAVRNAGELGSEVGARQTSYAAEEAVNALELASANNQAGHQARLAAARQAASERVCRILRDVAGSLFQPLRLEPTSLTQTVRLLAQAAYDERMLPSGQLHAERLGILADALEDAGCTEAAILEHLRGPGPHIRGCWVVDLLTGRT